jgi:hypothetical protein
LLSEAECTSNPGSAKSAPSHPAGLTHLLSTAKNRIRRIKGCPSAAEGEFAPWPSETADRGRHGATRLADVYKVQAVHLDLYRYDEAGRQRSDEAFSHLMRDGLCDVEGWVCDGNYVSTMSFRAGTADRIILLDIPWIVCLGSIAWRHVLFRGRRAEDVRHADRLNWSFIVYVATYESRMRSRVLDVATRSGADLIVLRSRRSVRAYLTGERRVAS